MVILLSALAVVVAAILLVTWFVVGGGFALIYAATALAVLSMVLLWAARWIGSTAEVAGPTEPEPLRELSAASDAREPEETDAAPAVEEPASAVADEVRPKRAAAPVAGHRDVADGPDEGLPRFPIAEYDTLWVAQIVPLLAELDDDELAVVEARERGGRHRAAVLDAVEAVRSGESAPEAPRPSTLPPEAASTAEADEVWAAGPEAESKVALAEPSPEELAEEEARWAAWADVAPPMADADVDEPAGSVEPVEVEVEALVAPEEPVEPVEPEGLVEPAEVEGASPAIEADQSAEAETDAGPLEDIEADPALFDWTQPEDEPVSDDGQEADGDPDPEVQVDPEAGVEVEASDEAAADAWDGEEPDGWDWSGVRNGAVSSGSVEAEVPEPAAAGGPRVRTFLGRRRSPVIVQRDDR